MTEISAISNSTIALNQSTRQEQISMMILKANAQDEQVVADILALNARQINILSENYAADSIDLYI
jgi:hypothetical protein